MLHVPYKGNAPAMADLIAGQTQVYFSNIPSALGVVRGGKIKALTMASRKRSQAMPEVPTVAESGLPGYEANGFWALLAPVATPADVVSRLNRESIRVLALPDVKERLAAQGLEAVANTPEKAADYMKAEIKKWSKVVRDLGLRVG